MAGSRALQHRGGRLRQAPPRQAGDGLGGLPRRPAPGELGRAAVAVRPRGQRPARSRGRARRPGRGGRPGDAGDGGGLLRHLEARRDPALDVGALRRRGHPAPDLRLPGEADRLLARPGRAHARRPGRGGGVARRESPGRRRRSGGHRRHRRRRPGAALLLVGHDRAREGHPPRPPLHPRPRGVHLLPRRPRRRALPRHGGVGLGGGDRAAPRAVAARRDPVRLRARGRVRPGEAARGAVEARGDEPVHDADRDAGDDGDRRRRRALPAEVPNRLLGRRAAESRGDPLVSRAVRANGARLLRADRVLSAVRQLPVHGGSRGLDGQAGARLGRADPRRGRAARSPRASAARSACARGRTRTTRSATGTTRRPPRRPSAGSGSTPRTPPSRTRTATSGTRGEPTT